MPSITLNTNHGAITIGLNSEKAPETVANFLSYAKEGFFEGTIFHRVIKGFMIQGGGFTADMEQKDTKAQIKNEANNGLLNTKGTIAMARTQDPHSATAQFFINAKNNDFLNHSSESVNGWGYCVFGEVTDGIEIVEAIEAVATGNSGFHQDVPVEAVVIESVEISE
ncbi:MAG: peptidylprolyl isomerase [Glaciecola sp.]|jgi:peptidyl-prolyl cis-trans isomerase B (cyclophilin B)|nr:peptidylprolyl isomerase [Glaciecola sp.]MDG1469203.1 peptidylprolyl isomerase [Glaciecola sp.]